MKFFSFLLLFLSDINQNEIQMETEETVKEECVAMSKTKRIWLAFVDIVLFTVLFYDFSVFVCHTFCDCFP